MNRIHRAPREWTHVHPVSPLLGGWPIIGLVAGVLLYNWAPNWVGADEGTQELVGFLTRSILWFVVGALVLLLGAIGIGYLQWRFAYYRLGDEAVYQRIGVIWRQQRQARLDRLQAVDVVQPLLARIFGFAALKIEVAGGENSGVALEYLRLADAEAMRNELLVLAAGAKRAASADADASSGAPSVGEAVAQAAEDLEGRSPEEVERAAQASLRDVVSSDRGVPETAAAAEHDIYAVRLGRLLGSIALSWPTIWLALLPVAVGIAVFGFSVDVGQVIAITVGASLFTLLPAIAGLLGYFWSRLNRGYGFRAALSEDGIRLRHGLLETRRQTVPPGRVQAVRFTQSLLWRRKDWWQVSINVAGYGEEQEAVSTLLPVGTRQDALTSLWLVLPDLGDPDPAGTVSLALSGKGEEGGFTAASTRARLFDPLQWRYRGVRATDKALLIRRGWLVREMFVVPHERTQSLGLVQGPLQRLRKVATLTVHSTRGPVRPAAEHLDLEDALALLDAQAVRAAEGRRRQTPAQWMSAVGLT